MDIVKANIVTSTAGRDKGEVFFVLATEGDFLLLADGKTRPDGGAVSQRIRSNETITNSELRKAIAAIRGSDQDQEG